MHGTRTPHVSYRPEERVESVPCDDSWWVWHGPCSLPRGVLHGKDLNRRGVPGTESVKEPQFEIVWQASSGAAPVVLRSATDADETTLAFFEELARLRRLAAPGELLVRNGDRARGPLLRLPLTDHDRYAPARKVPSSSSSSRPSAWR